MECISEWIGANPSQKKYVEVERLLKVGHVIKCGKIYNQSSDEVTV